MPDLWEPSSKIVLCSVPWDSDYKDVVKFKDKNARDDYFNSLDSFSFDNSTYMPINQPVCIALPYSSAYKYNYCYIDNSKLPVENEGDKKTYYYFISNVEYVNPSTSRIYLQLDVFTTYQFDFNFGIGYCERGHVAMCNEPSLSDDDIPRAMRRYLADDEGLNVGGEMVNYKTDVYSLQANDDAKVVDDYVSIVTTVDLTVSFGTVDNPQLKTARGGTFGGIFSGCDVYFIEKSHFVDFMRYMQDYSWISQCIISITVIPAALVRGADLSNKVQLNGTMPDYDIIKPAFNNDTVPHPVGTVDIDKIKQGFNDDANISQYGDLRKLWEYPYNVVEISSFNGNSIFLKPQLLQSNRINLYLIFCSIMPFAEACIYPSGYCNSDTNNGYTLSYSNASGNDMTRYVTNGDFVDTALWISDFPQFSIVNNSYIAYMASNAHTRAYSYASAEWSRDSSQASNLNGFVNSQMGLDVGMINTRNSYATDLNNVTRSNQLSTAVGLASGALGLVGNIATANVLGAGSSIVGMVGGTASNYANLENSRDSLNTSLANSQNTYNVNTDINDRNYNLAQFLTNGNYENTVRGIDAGYQDAALQSPSTSGSMGGQGFKYANGLLFNVVVKYKRITNAHISKIGDYFCKYGYYVKRFISVNQLQICTYFTYWKFTDIYITSARMNETEKNSIRGIFCKGVTVWENPSDIGNIAPVLNKPRDIRTYY